MVRPWALADFNYSYGITKVIVNLIALVAMQVANGMELSVSVAIILHASIATADVAISSF